jgi:hypothetical protein
MANIAYEVKQVFGTLKKDKIIGINTRFTVILKV